MRKMALLVLIVVFYGRNLYIIKARVASNNVLAYLFNEVQIG